MWGVKGLNPICCHHPSSPSASPQSIPSLGGDTRDPGGTQGTLRVAPRDPPVSPSAPPLTLWNSQPFSVVRIQRDSSTVGWHWSFCTCRASVRVSPVTRDPPCPQGPPMSPGTPSTYKELEDDAAVGVDVLEGHGARLLEADGVHEGGRALVRVGGHVVPKRHPRRPGAGDTDPGLCHQPEPRGRQDGDAGGGCDSPQAGGAGRRRWTWGFGDSTGNRRDRGWRAGDSPGDTSLCWTLIPGGSFCPREAGGLREESGSCAGDSAE